MKIKSSEEHVVSICSMQQFKMSILLGMLHSENAGSILLQNARYYSPSNMYNIPEDLDVQD
jgi:hypothetical protein